MTYSYPNALDHVVDGFNDRYGSISGIDHMNYSASFNKQMMHCLRQALYYELYGQSSKFVNGSKLPHDKIAIDFVNNFANTYDGVENPAYVPLKMASYAQKLCLDDSYDLSDVWSDTLASSLQKLLSELNVVHSYQTVYTINALLSDFQIKPDLDSMSDSAKQLRTIQLDMNQYMSEHEQLAYSLGLIVPNGVNDQTYSWKSTNISDVKQLSLMQTELQLIYQDASNMAPFIFTGMPVPNRFETPANARKWFKYAYYLKYKKTFDDDFVPDEVVRDVFDLNTKYIDGVRLSPVSQLNLNNAEAVQAFSLNTQDSSSYKLYTLQYYKYINNNDNEIINIGTFKPNNNSIITCNFDKTITLNNELGAHSQTLTPADPYYHEFFIGFHHDDKSIIFSKSSTRWAQWLGLFDLDNGPSLYTAKSFIPHLVGFDTQRVEASTSPEYNSLVIQKQDANKNIVFVKYQLSSIVDALHDVYKKNKNKLFATIDDFSVNINSFTPLSTFKIPSDKNILFSNQGFSYSGAQHLIFLSSQYHPSSIDLNMDQKLFVPHYNKGRFIYVIPWNKSDSSHWTAIPQVNFLDTTLGNVANMQVEDGSKPITYATELESNVSVDTNQLASIYQLVVYHWSDKNTIAQPNLNTIVRVSW